MPEPTVWIVLHVPPGSSLRPDAQLGWLRLAVSRALRTLVTDGVRWRELGLAAGRQDLITARPSLLGDFHDQDYVEAIHEIVDHLLGLREYARNVDGAAEWHIHLDGLPVLEEHLDLPTWLAEHEPRLHRLLYGADVAEGAALDAVSTAIVDVEIPEIVRQLDQLRRDLPDDLSAAVGHAKELVESACKTIIGQTGSGAGAELPALVTAALQKVGRHAKQVGSADPDAQLLKRLFGALQSQLEEVAGLRNRVGTGHGRAGDVDLDAPLARLVIGQALTAVAYLLHAADLNTIDGSTPDDRPATMVIDGGTP